VYVKPLLVTIFISSAPYGCKMSGYVLLKTVKIYIIVKNRISVFKLLVT